MRGDTPDDVLSPSGLTEKAIEWSRELRAAYPQSGLYSVATGELLWATRERIEVRSGMQLHHVIVTNSGVVVWLAHRPVGPAVNPADKPAWDQDFEHPSVEHSAPARKSHSLSKDGLGVRILANGVTVGSWRPEELIDRLDSFESRSVNGYTPWLAEADVHGDTLRLTTVDEQKVVIDLASGTELDRQSVQQPIVTRRGLIIGGILIVSSAGLALARKRPPAPAATEQPAAELQTALDDLTVTPPPPGLGRRRSGWHVPVRR